MDTTVDKIKKEGVYYSISEIKNFSIVQFIMLGLKIVYLLLSLVVCFNKEAHMYLVEHLLRKLPVIGTFLGVTDQINGMVICLPAAVVLCVGLTRIRTPIVVLFFDILTVSGCAALLGSLSHGWATSLEKKASNELVREFIELIGKEADKKHIWEHLTGADDIRTKYENFIQNYLEKDWSTIEKQLASMTKNEVSTHAEYLIQFLNEKFVKDHGLDPLKLETYAYASVQHTQPQLIEQVIEKKQPIIEEVYQQQPIIQEVYHHHGGKGSQGYKGLWEGSY